MRNDLNQNEKTNLSRLQYSQEFIPPPVVTGIKAFNNIRGWVLGLIPIMCKNKNKKICHGIRMDMIIATKRLNFQLKKHTNNFSLIYSILVTIASSI